MTNGTLNSGMFSTKNIENGFEPVIGFSDDNSENSGKTSM
jgi:hypothetical protein